MTSLEFYNLPVSQKYKEQEKYAMHQFVYVSIPFGDILSR